MAKLDVNSMEINAMIDKVANSAASAAAASIKSVLETGLGDIRKEISDFKGETNDRLSKVDARFNAMDARMKLLENAPKSRPASSSHGSAFSASANDNQQIFFVEVKGFYDWDTGLGEREDSVLSDWLDSFFTSIDSDLFDKGSTKASVVAHVLHKSMRLYLDITKAPNRGKAYVALANFKRCLTLNPLDGSECYAVIPDAAKKAKSSITGRALGIFKRFLANDNYRVEWSTQSIWLKITVPTRKTVKVVHFDRASSAWVVDEPELFSSAFDIKISPEEFAAQATPP